MIAPIAPYAIRGAIWYQGESNAGAASLYGLQMRTLIAEWRKHWNEGDFPFLFVQLPNFMAAQTKPSERVGGWMRIREEFVKTLAVPKTGMAMTIDIGEANDIHPEKQAGSGPAAGAMGPEQDLRQGRRTQRPALQVDAQRGR